MEINQKTVLSHEVDGRVIECLLPGDTPLGALFDALMNWKGYVVERMQQAHQAELEEASDKLAEEEPSEQEE